MYIPLFIYVGLLAKPFGIDNLNNGYYGKINKAELAVADSAYCLAHSLYTDAFQISKRSFGQDFFLAAENATKCEQISSSEIFDLLEKAILSGVLWEQIKKSECLSRFFQTHGLGFSKSYFYYDQLRKTSFAHLNNGVRKDIRKLCFHDQSVRTIPGLFNLFHYTRDRKTFKKLKEICITTGNLPGFDAIGENFTEKYDINDVPLLLRHLSYIELKWLYPYILDAIDRGAILPWHYASAIDYALFKEMTVYKQTKDSVYMSFQYEYGVIRANYLGEEYKNNNTKEVNEHRAKIGLEPIEDQLKKGTYGNKIESLIKSQGKYGFHRKEMNRKWRKKKYIPK